jgi:hypothetical protein
MSPSILLDLISNKEDKLKLKLWEAKISYDTEHPEEGVVEEGKRGMLSPTFWLNRTWEPFAITTQEGRSRTRAGEGTKPSRNGNRWKTLSGEASGFDSEPRGGEF